MAEGTLTESPFIRNMRLNLNVALLGDRVALVPYHEGLVELYNTWMKDPWLQGLVHWLVSVRPRSCWSL